ncbi:monooxygenase-like protein [Sphaerosporella brunnea]|uniref:Monooxygenase-like protein n=1 Tax=Sphaerosporella brunnea TaxID=1250544 RepID=A0A5J5EYK5_9PEZI|nr:monooxygenase-like protein [Sphaerosporella brunnea]
MSAGDPEEPHVLIIGAGIIGTILAHSLRANNIPFTLYERDAHISSRGQGWGISFHWALPTLLTLLPRHLHPLLHQSAIYPGPADVGITCVDARTLERRYNIPPQRRLNVRREQLRRLLLAELPVRWGKRVVSVHKDSESRVRAVFSDGSSACGTFLVGADGAGSMVRSLLLPDPKAGRLMQLPVRGVGFSLELPRWRVEPLLKAGGVIWMAVCEGGTYLWFSVLETPATPEGEFTVQMQLSWLWKSCGDDVPVGNEKRVQMVKRRVRGFAAELRDAIGCLTQDTVVAELRLADWSRCEWSNLGDRVALVGDAAHAMTMFRGEAANHGVADVMALVEGLKKVRAGQMEMGEMLATYEKDVRDRCKPAVLASRQACLDAHRLENVREGSPLLTRGLVTGKERTARL